MKEKPGVGIFFYVNNRFLFFTCPLNKAQQYGDFLNYPYSHDRVWEENCAKKYGVDFDYYPRGRVIYRKADGVYLIYYDRCLKTSIHKLSVRYAAEKTELHHDEHYRCHSCNKHYVS